MGNEHYIIYGSEFSPFSVKVRSYFRYKNIPHEWRPRTKENIEDFQKHAKLPLVPLVICPNGDVLQDSTPILEKMEQLFPENSINPVSQELQFLSQMIEEYADEWGNKPMFHYRWWREADQIEVSEGLASTIAPNASPDEQSLFAEQLRTRMVPRLSFVGSNEQNKETIERSLDDLLHLLEKHLTKRRFIFGGKPSLADFGLFGQLYGCTQQPTTRAILKEYPEILVWIEQMLRPESNGEWEEWGTLELTLLPILTNQIAELYFPWALENAHALKQEKAEFTVCLKGRDFKQDTMKYSARSLNVLKQKFTAVQERGALEEILLKAKCLQPLVSESW
ncbi:glutathione S-transferase family protein [Sneathiella sp. P13V-1]|uniref:glutathione S-transferase family protein n=1 Tax=Sneathiella sp. P13V-1 TaxID=2697366 RepID=UPI00187B37A5|nr:glutathione S-transferase [Sneathiella sp. P13V-1]MBE7637805.1 glutathione S-transferase family protein [Sneathiella sp. P13V-1]